MGKGNVHRWAVVRLHVLISKGVKSAALPPVTFRHLFDCGLTNSNEKLCIHCWAAVPLQWYSWIWVPLALLAWFTSTHSPPNP